MAKVIDLAQVRRKDRELTEEEEARYAEHKELVEAMSPMVEALARLVDDKLDGDEYDVPTVMTALQESCGILFAAAVWTAFDPEELPEDICNLAAGGVAGFMHVALMNLNTYPPPDDDCLH